MPAKKRRRKPLRLRILLIVMSVLLVASLVTTIILITKKKPKGTLAEATVVRASLSSSISSTGVVEEIEFKTDIPLAAFTAESPETLSEILENDYTVNLITFLSEGSQGPFLYRVTWVSEQLAGKKANISTTDAEQDIVKLAPAYFNWAAAEDAFEKATADGTTDAATVREYVLLLLLREGVSNIEPNVFPDEFWYIDESKTLTVDTSRINAMILKELKHLDKITYTLSGLTWDKGDMLVLDNKLFTVSYSELFATFTMSEYDIPTIHARLQNDERVYASVSINALTGRELIADIIKIEQGKSSSGISYFTLFGRLIFPEIATDTDGTEKGSYTYYDEFLSDSTVAYLGVDVKDNIRENEILSGYSVTVSAQKAVVENTLIVPTKCIYYDDTKRPYVTVVDGDGKEKRVYIKITLSTGTDAAVTAAEGYTLNEGDVLRYIADATLIGSLF